jgi:hypothetical protein
MTWFRAFRFDSYDETDPDPSHHPMSREEFLHLQEMTPGHDDIHPAQRWRKTAGEESRDRERA